MIKRVLFNLWTLSLLGILLLAWFWFRFVYLTVDQEAIDNLNGGKIEVIGHGGSGFASIWDPVPANSMESLRRALEDDRADGVEVDVQLSKDSVLMLYHDQFLDSKSPLKGCMEDYTAEELLATTYECGFGIDFFHDETLISLEQLVTWCQELDSFPLIYLDFHSYSYCRKSYDRDPIHARSLVRLIHQYNLPVDKIRILSTHLSLLLYLRDLQPDLYLIYEETDSFERGLKTTLAHGFADLAIGEDHMDADKARQLHEKGIRFVTFGGNDRYGIKKLIELNPDAIHVNDVPAMMDMMGR